MTPFCSVSGEAHISQENFCLLCRITLSKKPNIIDLDAIPSPVLAPLLSSLLQDCAIHVLALLASRSVAGSAVLAANIHAQKGSIPSTKQLALSMRSSRSTI
jgi:hypothetical protein